MTYQNNYQALRVNTYSFNNTCVLTLLCDAIRNFVSVLNVSLLTRLVYVPGHVCVDFDGGEGEAHEGNKGPADRIHYDETKLNRLAQVIRVHLELALLTDENKAKQNKANRRTREVITRRTNTILYAELILTRFVIACLLGHENHVFGAVVGTVVGKGQEQQSRVGILPLVHTCAHETQEREREREIRKVFRTSEGKHTGEVSNETTNVAP